jgi:hypothetical protein
VLHANAASKTRLAADKAEARYPTRLGALCRGASAFPGAKARDCEGP